MWERSRRHEAAEGPVASSTATRRPGWLPDQTSCSLDARVVPGAWPNGRKRAIPPRDGANQLCCARTQTRIRTAVGLMRADTDDRCWPACASNGSNPRQHGDPTQLG
jgi:hypothetical protein